MPVRLELEKKERNKDDMQARCKLLGAEKHHYQRVSPYVRYVFSFSAVSECSEAPRSQICSKILGLLMIPRTRVQGRKY